MLVSYKETELDLAESSPLSWVAIVQNTLGGKQRRPYSLHCTAENLRFREAQWNCGAVDAGKAWTSFFTKPAFRGTFSYLPPSTTGAHPRTPNQKSKAWKGSTCHPSPQLYVLPSLFKTESDCTSEKQLKRTQ